MGFGQTTTKGRRFPVEVLTGEEVRAIMDVAKKRRGSCGIRDRALVATLYCAGLRIAEALALMPKDVDLEAGSINVLDGKNHRQRIVGINEETSTLVQLWIAQRAKLGLNGRHPLFCTLEGAAMARPNVTQHFKALATRAGIEKRVHPHAFRHSHCSALIEGGIDMPTLQQDLGHTSLATTDRYAKHIRPEQVIAAGKGMAW